MMRIGQVVRRLGSTAAGLRAPGVGGVCADTWTPPGPPGEMHAPPLAPRDEAIFLLHATAEVEHALMVQYLFAAYSVKELPASDGRAGRVELIRHLLQHIAREEMAHLATVQNLLHLLGGPLHLDREHSPFASALLPFRFKLEPVSLGSLAKYVIAESPRPLPDNDVREKIEGIVTEQATASNDGVCVTHVGDLFRRLIDLFEYRLSDEDLVGAAGPFQATWNDWGFQPILREIGDTRVGGDRSLVIDFPDGAPAGRRARAVEALRKIADQGEGTDPETGRIESHFDWFWTIYTTFEKLASEPGDPVVWNIAVNPNTSVAPAARPPRHKMIDAAIESQVERGRITNPRSLHWAQLFNLRYRLLLQYLGHFLRLPDSSYLPTGDRTGRGYLLAGAFNEMRRLRKLARKLVQLPLRDDGADLHAGAPFELPYTTELPDFEAGRWSRHCDALRASAMLLAAMLEDASDERDPFVRALAAADAADLARFSALARGEPAPAPPQGFQKVVGILEEAVRGFPIGQHGPFWRNRTRDQFVADHLQIDDVDLGPPVYRNDDGSFSAEQSEVVRRLRGRAPRMPRERPPVPEERIRYIEEWIRDGCRDNEPAGAIGLAPEPDPAPETPSAPPPVTPRFAADILPLFRQFDVDSMRFLFDLTVFEEVRDHAAEIQDALSVGIMPCDGAWPATQIELFKRWIDGGKQP